MTVEVTPVKFKLPDKATIGTIRRESPDVLTVTVPAVTVENPPALKPVTEGDAPSVKVRVVEEPIELTGLVGLPAK